MQPSLAYIFHVAAHGARVLTLALFLLQPQHKYARWGDEFVEDDRVYALEERKRRESGDLNGTNSRGASPAASRRGSDDSAGNGGPGATDNAHAAPTHHHGTRRQKRKSGEPATSAAMAAGEELGDAAGGITDEAMALLHDAPWDAEETAASTKR